MSDVDRDIQFDRDFEELRKKKSIYERLVKKEDVIGALFDLLEIDEEKYDKALRYGKGDKDPQYKIILNYIEHLRNYIEEAPRRLEEVKELIADVDTGDFMEDWTNNYWPLFGGSRKKKEREKMGRKLQEALYKFKFNQSRSTPTKKEA